MKPEELLTQLKDIHMPELFIASSIPLGWWLLGITVIMAFTGIGLYLIKWYKSPKQTAIRMIKIIEKESIHNIGSSDYLSEVSEILRRVALSYYPRNQVAGLTGKAWLEFLDKTGKTKQFVVIGQPLITGPYQKNVTYDCQALFQLIYLWIKQCR